MTTRLEDYQALLADLGPQSLELVRASWPDACAVLSSDGLHAYLHCVRTLRSLGVPWGPVVTFLHCCPRVAKEVGERSALTLADSGIAVYGHTNDKALDGVFATAPIAAQRLRDAHQFNAYMKVVTEVARLAPQGLRPMLRHIDFLLEQLTPAELRRWALLGVQSHNRDVYAQEGYFDLRTPESKAFFQSSAQGTLFTDVERRLKLYLRALWQRAFALRTFPASLQASRPYLDEMGVHVPEAYRGYSGRGGVELYRAATAHIAAHMALSTQRFARSSLKPIQIVLLGLLEDARVEHLAARAMPGLRQLWLRYHSATSESTATFAALATRLSRALLDPAFDDPSPWVSKGRQMFFAAERDFGEPNCLRPIASLLGNDIGQMRLQFNAKTYVIEPLYRDDNRHLWLPDEDDEQVEIYEEIQAINPQASEGDESQSLDQPDQQGAEQGLKPTQVAPAAWDEDSLQGALRKIQYAEWDYIIGMSRPAWCTVQEKPLSAGDSSLALEALTRNEDLLQRLDYLIRGVRIQKPIKLRKQMEGDRFDVDMMINAMLDVRSRRTPDPRVHMRVDRKERDLAVLVLLDLSESTRDLVKGANCSVLELARDATFLLAEAMQRIGDRFAIHGFASNTREEIEYYRFKDFSHAYGNAAKARIAGMKAKHSTRMGAAIRHGGSFLRGLKADKKLIMLITDGEPSDIDVHDPNYLVMDAKKSVEEQSKSGILTFCISLDPKADNYVTRIFGVRNYVVVDHIRRLPEKLPALYLRLTR